MTDRVICCCGVVLPTHRLLAHLRGHGWTEPLEAWSDGGPVILEPDATPQEVQG